MHTLVSQYDLMLPGGRTKAPVLAQWFYTLPHHALPVGIAFWLLLVGGTWIAAQEKTSASSLVHRIGIAFVALGIFASSMPFRNVIMRLSIAEPTVPWSESLIDYLWLIPCSLPLLIALIKRRRAGRMELPS